jgi:protocatechuate 3,4-dioxygenase beta subunit
VAERVAALANGTSRTMTPAVFKVAAGLVLAASLAVLGEGLFLEGRAGGVRPQGVALGYYRAGLQPSSRSAPKGRPVVAQGNALGADAPRAPADEDGGRMTVTGRVLDAQGQPVGGAAVAIRGRPRRHFRAGDPASYRSELLGEGMADADGRFRIPATRASSARFWGTDAVAAAAGHALGWEAVPPNAAEPRVVIKLPAEQVIRGRLIDLQGLPVAGAKVSVVQLAVGRDGTTYNLNRAGLPPRFAPWPAPAVSDGQGRFVLRGCNRHNLLLSAEGASASAWLQLGPPEKGEDEALTLSLAPARVLTGRVVCGETGKPVARTRVVNIFGGNDARTDADGRFRLALRDHQRSIPLNVFPAEGEPYLSADPTVEWPKGALKHDVEIRLPRGSLVRGRVTEAGSGKPVAGASVTFYPRGAPPEGQEVTDGDGRFRIAARPGPGHLLIQGPTMDYVHQEVNGGLLVKGEPGGVRMYPDAAVPVDVPAKGAPGEVAVTLRRGLTFRGRVLDPEGKPVARAWLLHRLNHSDPRSAHDPPEACDGVFEVPGLDPDKTVPVFFLDPVHQWGGVARLSGKQAGQEVTVRLAPCGRAAARYVNQHGKPAAKAVVAPELVLTPGRSVWDADPTRKKELIADQVSLLTLDQHNYGGKVRTDAEGRVTFPALIPGATYRVTHFEKPNMTEREFTVAPGKTTDLGEVVTWQPD